MTIKFFLDENIPFSTLEVIHKLGYQAEHGVHILDLEHARKHVCVNDYVFDNLVINSTDNIPVVLDKPLKLPYHVKNSDLLMTETGIPVLVGGEQCHLPYILKRDYWSNLFYDAGLFSHHFHKSFGWERELLSYHLEFNLNERYVKSGLNESVLAELNHKFRNVFLNDCRTHSILISTTDPEVVEKLNAETQQNGCPLKLL